MCSREFHGGSKRRISSLLVVWFVVVELSFCSLVFSFLLSGGAGGMADARRVTDAVDPSLSASWFSVNFSCNFLALCFPSPVPLRQTSFDLCSSSYAGLSLLLK